LTDAAILPPGPPKTLVGRQVDVELIRSFVVRAAAEGGAILVSGEPGVGKSVLLDAAAEAAAAAGIRILRAAGVEFEASVSFSALNQLLIPLHDRLEELAPAHREALSVALGLDDGPPSDRLTVSSAVLALLREAAATRPVLVIIDDLPWADRSSAVVLGFVARRLAGSRVGFLAASRSDQESFLDRTGVARHELLPLDDTAASRLVSDHFPALGPEFRQRVVAEAQGNPLALLELAAVLSGPQHALSRRPPTILPLTRRLQDLFASRVGDLPARGYASHGESWSLALALRLAAFWLLRADGEDPILLLDDVFAELDAGRRDRFAELAGEAEQVLVTAAVTADVPARLHGTEFTVAEGAIARAA